MFHIAFYHSVLPNEFSRKLLPLVTSAPFKEKLENLSFLLLMKVKKDLRLLKKNLLPLH